MTENSSDKPEVAADSRRAFIKSSAQVAVTAPAVAMLLGATVRSASAQAIDPYTATNLHILDDFTFGNNEEDIDAITLGSNFNPNNGQANQDDHLV